MQSPSSKQQDRDRLKETVLEGVSKTHSAFTRGFKTIKALQSHEVLALALRMLWDHFPGRPDLENKVGNSSSPGDGLLYDEEHVAQSKEILHDLDEAWRDAKNLREFPPPPKLKEMSKICLILTGMQKQILLLDFLEKGLTDANLRLNEKELVDIFKEEHRPYATLFYTEQFRAIPREWCEGSHAIFGEEEPMPLVYIVDEPQNGSYGSVLKVKDPFTNKIYVRKQQIISSDVKLMQSARNHVEQETRRLKGLRHRHVVELVKSYERGNAYGLVIRPAANSDLGKLLERYKKDKFSPRKECKDSKWLHPVFCTAFGCLAQGLAYIHGCNLRHKDVKPDNILYEQPRGPENTYDRFLWADFGLSYDFSDKEDSKTRSTKLYSPRYAPPEVVAANAQEKSKTVVTLGAVWENGEDMIRAEMSPSASDQEIEAHGRAADIFALGCIFLELLSRLVNDDLPLRTCHRGKPMFADNIQSLCDWATERKRVAKREAADTAKLRPVFDIAIAMIDRNPNQRLGINDVVKRLMKAGNDFACQSCREEYHSQRGTVSPPSSPTVMTPLSFALPQRQPSPRPRLSRSYTAMSMSRLRNRL